MIPVADRYLVVFQNLAAAVVGVYRSDPDLADSEVEPALSPLVAALNTKRLGKAFDHRPPNSLGKA